MSLRPVYIIGSLFVAVSAFALFTHPTARHVLSHPTGTGPLTVDASNAGAWFRAMKPYCNPVEVEAWHQWSPPPATEQGTGYSAACYALAGKIDRARELILTVPQEDQWRAAGTVFNVAHPVADAGDDRSAGPIMELVLEFWPNHYMALYHAGMSSYTLGEHERARKHLREFLRHYNQNDGWRSNALTVLGYLEE